MMYLQGFLLLCVLHLKGHLTHGSCVGRFEYPTIENFRFKQTATENGVMVLAEAELTSVDQVTWTWFIREFYESWPNMALYYFVPDEGDDKFEVTALRVSNSTIKFRIKGGPLEDPKKKLYTRMSIEHPCTTIVLTMNVHTFQLVADGTVHLPVFIEMPQPQYIVAPGDPLILKMKIESQLGDSTAHYGFSRHLHRAGDSLVLQQAFDNITRYNVGAQNMNYTKYVQNSGGFSNFSAYIKFRPFLRTDAGVYSVSLQTNYWLRGSPYRFHTMVLLQTFVDLRSRRKVPPAFLIYNQLAWIFNHTQAIDKDGTYIIPLPKKSLWKPSLMCFVHSQRSQRLRVYKRNDRKRIPVRKSSQVFGLKTITGEAYNVKPGSRNNYTCNSLDNEGRVNFRIQWFYQVKLIRRQPEERAMSVKRRRTIRLRCVGSGSPRPFVKFYLFDSIFGFIPHSKDFTSVYKANEIQKTDNFKISSRYNRRRKQVTGRLTVQDSDTLKPFRILLCLIGNDYSFDYYRYYIVKY